MKDEEKQVYVAKSFSKQFITNVFNVGIIFQSFWVRYCSVFSNIMDRKFMESELRFVLCCGIIFWIIYLFQKII